MNYINQLKSILTASGWSQEELARELEVSFPALNAWLNNRSKPRKNSLIKIKRVFLSVVGSEEVDIEDVLKAKEKALKHKISAINIVEDKQKLDKLSLYLTYHTNTIEGSTMTLSDVEDVLFENKSLSNRSGVEQAEARNHQAALLWVLNEIVYENRALRLDDNFILGIHLRLMNGIISDAGQYREHTVRIMGSHVTLANWQKVPELMSKLTKDLSKQSEDKIFDLAKVHSFFEQIHPFSDGNGRTGRLLMLAQALKWGLTPPIVEKERKFAYYKYLEMAQSKRNLLPLEIFIANSIDFTNKILTDK